MKTHGRRTAWQVVLAAVAAAVVVGLCLLLRPGQASNVLLITLDTTRADRLGCYGCRDAETPALDSLAATGLRFQNAFTQVPLTLPSHTTILTGLCPPEHGVRVNGRHKLGAEATTLPEVFRRHGYRTAAFLAGAVLDRRFGLDRGFDTYDDRMQPVPPGLRVSDTENPANVVADRALAWLGQHGNKPFFCWVHFYDPHPPFEPPEPFKSRHKDPYDGDIAFMDSQIKRLLDFLESSGVRANTLVVAVGDHGESFGEHQETGHGPLLYEPTMHVPLLMVLPGHVPAGRTDDSVAALADLAATTLSLCHWRKPAGMGGRNLLATGEGNGGAAAYGETQYTLYGYGWAELLSLTTARWRYIKGPDPELYDRLADPGETRNLITTEAAQAARMRTVLEKTTAGMRQVKAMAPAMDRKALAALRSLGYLSGTSGDSAADDNESRKDPKAMMPVLNLSQEVEQKAATLINLGRGQEALALLQPVVAHYPDLPGPRKTMIEALESLDRLPAAQPHIEAYLAHDPTDREMLARLGKVHLAAGRTDEAVRVLTHALGLPTSVIEPVNTNGTSQIAVNMELDLGLALMKLGRQKEAIQQFAHVIADDPGNFQAHNNLGCIYSEQGKWEEGIRHLRAAMATVPGRTNQRANLVAVLIAAGKDQAQRGSRHAAAVYFRQAIEIDAGNVEAKTNLASVVGVEEKRD